MASLIVVDFNSIEKTVDYILHVNERIINCPDLHFIIVENGDHKETEKLRQLSSGYEKHIINGLDIEIHTIENLKVAYYFANKNLGYAKGNNIGTIISDELYKDEYYIVSNNDLILQKDLDWNKIKKIYQMNKEVCIIGPNIVGKDGLPQSPNKRINPFRTLIIDYLVFKPLKKQSDLDYSDNNKECFRVSGCFMIIKAALFIEAGRFDEGTFLFCEEMIMSERLIEKGYKVFFYNDYKLLHNHGETIKSNASFRKSETWMHKSYLYYFEKYRGMSKRMSYLSILCFHTYLLRRGITSFLYKSLSK